MRPRVFQSADARVGRAVVACLIAWTTGVASHAAEGARGSRPGDGAALATSGATQRLSLSGAELIATLDRSDIRLWERAVLTLVVRAEQGTRVRWPELPGSIGELRLTLQDDPPPIARDGAVERRRSWTIEGYLPGAFEIPALGVRVESVAGSEPRTLTTQPMAIRVVSSLSPDDPALAAADPDGAPMFEPAPLRPAPPLPPEPAPAWAGARPYGVGAVAIVLAVAVVLTARRLRPRSGGAVEDPDALTRLASAVAAGRGEGVLSHADAALRDAIAARLAMDSNEPLSDLADALASAGADGVRESDRALVDAGRVVARARYAGDRAGPDDALALARRSLDVVLNARGAASSGVGGAA